jgi:hypothetical protein
MRDKLFLLAAVAVILMAALALSFVPLAPTAYAKGGPPAKITWSQNPVTATLPAGTPFTTTATFSTLVTFTSTATLHNATLRLTPSLRSVVTISPTTFAIISATVPYTVEIDVLLPTNSQRESYGGTLTVRTGHRAYASPLHLHFWVQR